MNSLLVCSLPFSYKYSQFFIRSFNETLTYLSIPLQQNLKFLANKGTSTMLGYDAILNEIIDFNYRHLLNILSCTSRIVLNE